ncbi:MAG TPA: phosphoglycerate kinase [Rhodospirillaceae bacterium]|jgi:phosphoglycerate kinase|nr:phosphoglycerate kinase [Alphaproteobacteria bacterium]HBH26584.1 phosphoglycerate kinase [Rhodospirillaceae bacterium]
MKALPDLDLSGKTVLLRADLNVPAYRGRVTDATRIDRLRPTIDLLRARGARTLILSHFGRPDGEEHPEMSLAFLLPVLEDRWRCPVGFAQSCVGSRARALAETLGPGGVGLLENVRFHKGEEANEAAFAARLAELGDVFVNDAFSAAHRAHASTEGLAHHLPAVPGPLMTAELCALEKALENPRRPAAAIVGGSKVSTKLGVLHNLIRRVDLLVLGGGMANTFLAAKGLGLGSSLAERGAAEQARTVLSAADKRGCEVLLPRDAVCVQQIREGAPATIFPVDEIPDGWAAIDLGPASVQAACQKLGSCRATLWNGPMGVFEIKPFDAGTTALARCVANFTHSGQMISVAGGGDTNAALENAGVVGAFTYLSLAGGAFLEWLEGRTLPGVAALQASSAAA